VLQKRTVLAFDEMKFPQSLVDTRSGCELEFLSSRTMLEEALLILLLVIPLPPNKTFRMAIRIPATVALLWWLLPNGVFFGICAALIFAIGWWLLQRLPLYPFAFRILFGFLFAEQLVPTSLTDGEDKRAGLPDGWSHHLACFSVGLLAHAMMTKAFQDR
jgi:hypothetical protein